MSMRHKLILWAVRRELREHGDEIRAELERLRAIRSLPELRAWAAEKGGALAGLVRRHGPRALELLRTELARRAPRGSGKAP